MVLIWNDLSCGDREAGAVLVALNSLFQIAAFALLGYFYLKVLPGWLGLSTVGLHLSIGEIAATVAIFLGIPLVAGFLTRTVARVVRRVVIALEPDREGVEPGTSARLPDERTATLAFTAAGNNFELAIAVCIGVFGVTSGEALAGVVGPLIEVPVLVGLVYVSLWGRKHLAWPGGRRGAGGAPPIEPEAA